MWSLLASMEIRTSAANTHSCCVCVLDVVIGLSEATKQMSPKRVHLRFHIAEFSASDLNEKQKKAEKATF
jgi:hypothetical protein